MAARKLLMVLGGAWHDFKGFNEFWTPLLESAGFPVESTFDLAALNQLDKGNYTHILLNTCLGEKGDGPSAASKMSDNQAHNLHSWVQNGGGLLALHSATVTSQTSPEFQSLVGGAFITHPPRFAFTVYPMAIDHPIIEGIHAFTVSDELYIESYDPSVQVSMVAVDRGVSYPMVWSRPEGKGRVAHIAMGHDGEVWQLKQYQQLVFQALNWVK
jgi:uncharacterized protein